MTSKIIDYKIPITSVILNKLYLGDLTDAKNEELLKSLGITDVICLSSRGLIDRQGIKTHYTPLIDDYGNTQEDFNYIVNLLGKLLDNGSVVLVHCAMGVSRSPTIVATWLAKNKVMSFDKATELLVSLRPIVEPKYPLRKLARTYLGET